MRSPPVNARSAVLGNESSLRNNAGNRGKVEIGAGKGTDGWRQPLVGSGQVRGMKYIHVEHGVRDVFVKTRIDRAIEIAASPGALTRGQEKTCCNKRI